MLPRLVSGTDRGENGVKFRLRRTVARALILGLLGVIGMVIAPNASADSVQPTATCYYRVMATDGLAVRESPGGLFLKWKYYPDVVSSSCTVVYQYSRWWRSVYCSCAADGIGWMADEWLMRI